jgi:hypothetical protein
VRRHGFHPRERDYECMEFAPDMLLSPIELERLRDARKRLEQARASLARAAA